MRILKLLCFFMLLVQGTFAWQNTTVIPKDTLVKPKTTISYSAPVDSSKQKDIMDLVHGIFKKDATASINKPAPKLNLAIIPTVGYTLSTGLIAGLSSVGTFYTQKDHSLNISNFNLQALQDAHKQNILFIQSNIWADHDNYKLVSDFRFEKYPDVTYGLGDTTTTKRPDPITYNYVRLYQTAMRRVVSDFYVGIGYDLDIHYNIVEDNVKPVPPVKKGKKGKKQILTEYQIYTGVNTRTSPRTISSGYTFNFLYDTRRNPENPLRGTFFDLIFRNNYKFLGSSVDYTSVVLDFRKYIKLSEHSNNVLALWTYNWLILDGKPPYFDLPSTGSDMYNNTGRGYPINRFRGRHMLYVEAEYRFGITKNGLLGGVVFGNAANYSTNLVAPPNGATNIDGLNNILPAAGAGLRIKINRRSNTNLCIDYGFGVQGSRGFFVNLGEVF